MLVTSSLVERASRPFDRPKVGQASRLSILCALLLTSCSRSPNPQRELERGVAYLRESKPAKAASHFERALSAAPATPQALNYLAVCQLQTGQPDAAITNLLTALRLDDAYRAAGQSEKALDNYELALRANPDYTDARFNYAILLTEQGYTDDASQQYKNLLRANPNDAAAHLSLASLYARDRTKISDARQHYEAYLRLAPHSPLARDIRRWLDANR